MAALFGCLWVINSSTSTAAFLFSNLATDESLNTAGTLTGFQATGAISVGFKVLAPTTLSSVEFRLRSNNGASTSKDATLVLRDDNAGNPGAKLAEFNTVTLGTSFQIASFNPTTNVVLTSGSTYWLTLGTTIEGGGDGLVAVRAPQPSILAARTVSLLGCVWERPKFKSLRLFLPKRHRFRS